ncbi:GNAT family N-acetyltransferase [Psychromonas sp. KJ10-10]|uniref:GNAT family N-acetyltransferase n=1 Tax=Psychromonas sp. KJ10-10 TaxID=3391823 RepID=UPI0039B3B44B
MMIEILKLTYSNAEQYAELVKKIHIAEEQIKFASTPEDFLLDVCETTHLHIIKFDGDVIGFFKLDTNYHSSYRFCPETAIGLRSFAIDKGQQGKGLGTKIVKALFSYLKTYYVNIREIYLTVNYKNLGAKACYEKGGFECLNEKYLGGDAGPQRIPVTIQDAKFSKL